MIQTEETSKIAVEVLQVFTAKQAWHYYAIPFKNEASTLSVYASEEKWSEDVQDEMEVILEKSIFVETLPDKKINELLLRHYRRQNSSETPSNEFNVSNDFLNQIVREAKEVGSSDIHFESFEDKCRVRIRIDGRLTERYSIKKEDYPALVNKVKIKARLDIAERRLPQDGRINFREGNESFDIRVSVIPTLFGEKIVLRLLNKDATNIDIKNLGFNEDQLKQYLNSIRKPHGIVLISGPTGTGKTTTLYASLKILNNKETNILTIEDPVEYTLEGINQVQLKEDIGLSFSEVLRSFLRQDPDIIMLGEIRDQQTAQMAIRAALTGHLVLSTIHTNSAWGTISRLLDMDLPPYLIASTMNASVAQRLVRLLCENCKSETEFSGDEWPINSSKPNVRSKSVAVGCEECHFTGYHGRIALYELITIDKEVSVLIKNQEFEVDDILKEKGVKKISDQATDLFCQGRTSIEEIHNLLLE